MTRRAPSKLFDFKSKLKSLNTKSTSSYRKIVLRALPKLVKLDNVEVTPEEVSEALRGPVNNHESHQQPKEEVYEEDYETAYRAQAAQSSFRGHSPVREVKLA